MNQLLFKNALGRVRMVETDRKVRKGDSKVGEFKILAPISHRSWNHPGKLKLYDHNLVHVHNIKVYMHLKKL